VYDISTSPSTPRFYGAIANGFNHSIYDIAIQGDYAYLAIKPGVGARNTKELMILDIRNPTPQATTGGFNATETNSDTEGAHSLYLLGNKLYLGREKVNNPKNDLYIFDISTPTAPLLLGKKNTGQQTGGLFSTLFVSRDLLLAGSNKGEALHMMHEDSTTPTAHGCSSLDLHAGILDMVYHKNTIYAATTGDTFLHIIYDEQHDTVCN
jgi:hypothetical protein